METPVHSVPVKTSESVIRLTTIVPDTTVESEAAQHVQEPEDEQVEDRSRKEALWRDLGETQINVSVMDASRLEMVCCLSLYLIMALLTSVGLFLGSGAALAVAGPFGGVLAYLLVGTVISSVVSCLGEMTALMPVNAPVVEFPRRFLDRGVGFAVGWMYWFTFVVVAAQNLVIAARTAKLHYDDDKTFLAWGRGENVDAHIWFALFMFTVLIINLFPVKYLGMFDYAMGTMKLVFIVFLIVMSIVLDTIPPRANSYHDGPVGTKYWNLPYESIKSVYQVWSRSGSVQREIGGSAGKLLGMWSACINVMYDYAGLEIFAAPAAESKSLADSESMKMAARKIYIRVMVLYTLAFLTGSFLVPSDHPFINGHAQSTSSRSIFLIAVVEAGIPTLAHFYNVIFLITTLTCAINSVYVASRVLHTLALREQTGPNFITRRLQRCNSGVPMRTVVVTVIMMFLGFMSHNDSEKGPRLDGLASNATVSFLVIYIIICATYLCFYKALKEARASGNPSECYATFYDRNNPRYPYKSHAQWFKALWGMTACTILCIFSGATTFLRTPFDTHGFIVSYISIPVFLVLLIGYKIRHHGLRISRWGPERSCDLRNCVQTTSEKRKGVLEFPDHGYTWNNARSFFGWVWVWMK
ncbi:amino acid transporter [Coccidioides posadasii str. Silveira]|uniref:Amino acid transporter n=1 Tax=Coccidioides posadasii (strain RMSCC 757 / Silveira) TaxID=443226 RepID=E9CY60_COCPS|nr:amino acid transporter [Coccidioides posadasii str. Silveira]